ncbi:hypothetical protein ANN_24016 [Periplaneta americana]|uniref:Uncharacterized protein n=1 Tax=Periplaneta americana TaxID=6978 RepID=A0ABQ8S1W8_PERAM|nr:hypothetical protein ANN_24016 [Periplaneta americana]
MYTIKMLTKYRYRKFYYGGDDGILKISRQLVFFPPLYKGFRNGASRFKEQTDDQALIAMSEEELQCGVYKLKTVANAYNFEISKSKTEIMALKGKDPYGAHSVGSRPTSHSYRVHLSTAKLLATTVIAMQQDFPEFKYDFTDIRELQVYTKYFVRDRAYLLVFRTEPIRACYIGHSVSDRTVLSPTVRCDDNYTHYYEGAACYIGHPVSDRTVLSPTVRCDDNYTHYYEGAACYVGHSVSDRTVLSRTVQCDSYYTRYYK